MREQIENSPQGSPRERPATAMVAIRGPDEGKEDSEYEGISVGAASVSTLREGTEDYPQPSDREGARGTHTMKEWVPQTMAQKMRFFEAMENWKAMEDASESIQKLSWKTGPHDEAVWDHASCWALVVMQTGHTSFLQSLGYRTVSDDKWHKAPMDGGPALKFSLTKSESHAYHNWYLVDCELLGSAINGGQMVKWRSPRRLCQLRWDLHDRVKTWMGESYSLHFSRTPFAKTGGPPGTMARLSAWLETLSNVLNNGTAMPRTVSLALRFFQVPFIEGLDVDPRDVDARDVDERRQSVASDGTA